MKSILGKPMLWHLINRLKGSKLINKIVISVPNKKSDEVLLKLAKEMGVDSFAGSEEDVLDRYYRAARKYNAETIVFQGGFDTEVFSFHALETAWKEADKPSERENITAYIWNNPSKFNFSRYQYSEDLSHIRLVVDYEEDYKLMTEIFKNLYKSDNKFFRIQEIINFISKNPHVLGINTIHAARDKIIKDKIVEKERIIKDNLCLY